MTPASPFPIVELRRYTTADGQREAFGKCFDTLFPEAFQQLGCIAFGQFHERDKPNGFTWMRGFTDVGARGIANAAFYFGPLWKEHRAQMNERLVDSDHVLLLEPATEEQGLPVFPAVDPVCGPPERSGVVVAHILAAVDEQRLLREAEPWFAKYSGEGVRELAVLRSLQGPNTFPNHPVRTDGPFVVWLGIAPDDLALNQSFRSRVREASLHLVATGLARSEPELVLLDPTPRSRLRWPTGP